MNPSFDTKKRSFPAWLIVLLVSFLIVFSLIEMVHPHIIEQLMDGTFDKGSIAMQK